MKTILEQYSEPVPSEEELASMSVTGRKYAMPMVDWTRYLADKSKSLPTDTKDAPA